MTPRERVWLVALAVAVVALIAWWYPGAPKPTVSIYWLFEVVPTGAPPTLSLQEMRKVEARHHARLLQRPAQSVSLLRDYPALFDRFDRDPNAASPAPLFFVLEKPYSHSKKQLRLAIEARHSLDVPSRRALMRRMVIVRGVEAMSQGDECRQLGDDIVYAEDNFQGIGLLVSGGAALGLEACLVGGPKHTEKGL